LIAPNIFATLGILVAHAYSLITHTPFELGTYVLFSVLCAAASYIAVPAVQRMAIPEASPTLPLAASLGLTFSYNVTIGIPVYIEIAKLLMRYIYAEPDPSMPAWQPRGSTSMQRARGSRLASRTFKCGTQAERALLASSGPGD